MNGGMPGLPVHHQLPGFTQTHVHWATDAIQPSHPLPSPSPPAFNLSQHQGLFKWVSSLHQVAKVFLCIYIYLFYWITTGQDQWGMITKWLSFHLFYFEKVFNKLLTLSYILVNAEYILKNISVVKVVVISDSIYKASIILFLSNWH